MESYSFFRNCRCDKCNRPVEISNNAVVLDAELNGFEMEHMLAYGRHLFPVYEDGHKICDGSPSRAQYLEGQERDARSSYPYRAEHETAWRAAYARVLLKCGAST